MLLASYVVAFHLALFIYWKTRFGRHYVFTGPPERRDTNMRGVGERRIPEMCSCGRRHVQMADDPFCTEYPDDNWQPAPTMTVILMKTWTRLLVAT